MQVRHLMSTDVVTLDAGAALDLADDLMKQKRIRHLPVVHGERLVGLVSQRDLFRAGLSTVLQFRRHVSKEWLQHIPVDEVMTRSVTTIDPCSSVDSSGHMVGSTDLPPAPSTKEAFQFVKYRASPAFSDASSGAAVSGSAA